MATDHEPTTASSETPEAYSGMAAPVAADTPQWRAWAGISHDEMILAGPFHTTPPMRMPEHTWGLTITAVDLPDDGEQDGENLLCTGCWENTQPPADLYDGEVVVRLAPATERAHDTDANVNVIMLLACHARWRHVGTWPELDREWPRVIAPTAAACLHLHAARAPKDTDTASLTRIPPDYAPPDRHQDPLAALLDAGLLTPGERLLWHQHTSKCHIVHARHDGTLELADGRTFASPQGALAALGQTTTSGWRLLRRERDGRSLHELRADLRAHNTNEPPPDTTTNHAAAPTS